MPAKLAIVKRKESQNEVLTKTTIIEARIDFLVWQVSLTLKEAEELLRLQKIYSSRRQRDKERIAA